MHTCSRRAPENDKATDFANGKSAKSKAAEKAAVLTQRIEAATAANTALADLVAELALTKVEDSAAAGRVVV